MKRMELRLARILRHVPEKEPILVQTLAVRASRSQSITLNLALVYIGELIASDYLTYTSEAEVQRGKEPYPSEIVSGGYYRFDSECWVCGKPMSKQVDIYTTSLKWDCKDCMVKWSEDVSDT